MDGKSDPPPHDDRELATCDLLQLDMTLVVSRVEDQSLPKRANPFLRWDQRLTNMVRLVFFRVEVVSMNRVDSSEVV